MIKLAVYLPDDEPVAEYPIVVANILASALETLAAVLAKRSAALRPLAVGADRGQLPRPFPRATDELTIIQIPPTGARTQATTRLPPPAPPKACNLIKRNTRS